MKMQETFFFLGLSLSLRKAGIINYLISQGAVINITVVAGGSVEWMLPRRHQGELKSLSLRPSGVPKL